MLRDVMSVLSVLDERGTAEICKCEVWKIINDNIKANLNITDAFRYKSRAVDMNEGNNSYSRHHED